MRKLNYQSLVVSESLNMPKTIPTAPPKPVVVPVEVAKPPEPVVHPGPAIPSKPCIVHPGVAIPTKPCKKEMMFDNISNMMLLCKLTPINVQKRDSIGYSRKMVDVAYPRRRIKLDVIESSEDFFIKLPTFKRNTGSSIGQNFKAHGL
jgi:hypothetical protein